jgi:thioredoxin reductase
MLDRAQNNPKIKFVLNAQIKHWRGENGVLSGFTYVDTLSGEESQVRVQYAQCLSAALIQKINVQSLQSLRCSNVPLHYQLDCKGAFIAIGHKPNTGFLGDKVHSEYLLCRSLPLLTVSISIHL